VGKIKASEYSKKFKTDAQLFSFASILCDVEKLKQTYLSTSWATSQNFAQTLDDDDDDEADEEDEQQQQNVNDDAKSEVEKAILAEANLQKQSSKSNGPSLKVPVKIIIVDQYRENKTQKSLRHLLSPILSQIDLLPVGYFTCVYSWFYSLTVVFVRV